MGRDGIPPGIDKREPEAAVLIGGDNLFLNAMGYFHPSDARIVHQLVTPERDHHILVKRGCAVRIIDRACDLRGGLELEGNVYCGAVLGHKA